jgi:hypothetical protein
MNVNGKGVFPFVRRNQQRQQNQTRPSSYSGKSTASASKSTGSSARSVRGMVELRNGEKEDITVVNDIMKSLASLHSSSPIAFVHLYKKCADPTFKILGADKKTLIEKKLMLPDGSISSTVRNIVISGVIFDEYNIMMHERAYSIFGNHSYCTQE